MITLCSNRTMTLLLLLTLGGAMLVPGCGAKASQETNDALAKGLAALVEDDVEGFAQLVVPDQREGLGDVDEMGFFRSAMSYTIDNDADTDVTDASATIRVKLFFDAEAKQFSNVYFVMKKVDDKWLFDLAATIKREKEMNPGYEFKIYEWTE